jgi:CheY-like chemotaxis protein
MYASLWAIQDRPEVPHSNGQTHASGGGASARMTGASTSSQTGSRSASHPSLESVDPWKEFIVIAHNGRDSVRPRNDYEIALASTPDDSWHRTASSSPAPTAAAAKPQATRVAGTRVLVVDDEEAVRRIAGESLRRAGFEVVMASDGVEAVALISGGDVRFDAMLLDMNMTRMGGVETCRVIKRLLPDLPVILTSGYSEEDVLSRFEIGLIAGFIQKPFLLSALVRTMQEAVTRGQSRRRSVVTVRTGVADDVATAVHDLNNLCASILILAERAVDLSPPGTKLASYLAAIDESGQRLAGVARRLRDVAIQLRAATDT